GTVTVCGASVTAAGRVMPIGASTAVMPRIVMRGSVPVMMLIRVSPGLWFVFVRGFQARWRDRGLRLLAREMQEPGRSALWDAHPTLWSKSALAGCRNAAGAKRRGRGRACRPGV